MCLRCTYLMIPKLCENGQDCVKLKAPGSFERPGTTSTTQCYIPKYLEPLRQPQPLRNVTSRNIWNHGVNYNHYTELHSEMFETTASTTTTTQCYISKHLKATVNFKWFTTKLPILCEQIHESRNTCHVQAICRRVIRVEYVVEELAMGEDSLLLIPFSPVSIIPPMPHTHSFTYSCLYVTFSRWQCR